MYSGGKRIGRGLAPLFTLGIFVWVGAPAPALADGATRDLPDSYTPGAACAVAVAIDAPLGTVVVVVEDSPPPGWTEIGSISDDGTYDSENHKVKWGPFFENLSRTLTYDVTPPGGATGQQCFAGIVSFDGNNEPITGDECFGPPVPTVSEWGLVVMGLLVLAAGTIMLRRAPTRGGV